MYNLPTIPHNELVVFEGDFTFGGDSNVGIYYPLVGGDIGESIYNGEANRQGK